MTPHTLISGTIVNLDKVQQIDFEPRRRKIIYRYSLEPMSHIVELHPDYASFENTKNTLQNIGKPPEIKLNNHYVDNPCSVYNP